ncbi:MAG TPA: DinB family protein [Candidatus Dormibacteraeota bacterium]|nr:DinB family protein [Candidatus Dormibacteraeota bacterium]
MKRWTLALGALFLAAGMVGSTAFARNAESRVAAEDKTPPSYDMKPQAILDLQGLQKKFVGLAEAMPAEKFTWRPAAGVRSVSELYLHVALANFNIPTMMGVTPAAGIDKEGFEKSTTDKAKVIEQLNKSFAFAISAVDKMSNSDFAKPEKKLGPDANDGDVVYLLVVHNHEHLGQSIAYARMNGVVPPWTAEAMKKNPKAPVE